MCFLGYTIFSLLKDLTAIQASVDTLSRMSSASETFHSIKAVSQKTGLSTHVIRVWEKRYGAVRPVRTGSNRRVYSSAEVERLDLLGRATTLGHSIGNIAGLPSESLLSLVQSQPVTSSAPDRSTSRGVRLIAGRAIPTPVAAEQLLESCLGHIRRLDHQAFEACLASAMVSMGLQGMLQGLISPLAHAIGEEWRRGTLKIAHEHFASSVIRTCLWDASRTFAPVDSAPDLVVATPAGQHHELGAVMVAAAARNQGWRVTYLGTCLPATEIAGAAIQNAAKAVLISIVYPEDDEALPSELLTLRKTLPTKTRLLVGGAASIGYLETLRKIDAVVLDDLNALYPALQAIRSGHT